MAKVGRQRAALVTAAPGRADLRKHLGDAIITLDGILPTIANAGDIGYLRGTV